MEREQTVIAGRMRTDPFRGELTFALPVDATAPGRARRALARFLGDDDRLPSAQLAASELVTNVVRHGEASARGAFELRISARDERLRVGVRGPGPRFVPVVEHPNQSGGWGLGIVAAITRDWGIDDEPGGVVVWFDL